MFLFSDPTVNSIVAGFVKTMSELEKLIAKQTTYLETEEESIRLLDNNMHARRIEISRAGTILDRINNIINPKTIEAVDPQ